jgi:hypothetical protein
MSGRSQLGHKAGGIVVLLVGLAEWRSILPVWLAAAVAWTLTQILPLGLKMLADYRLRHRNAALLARRQALVEEWGLEPEIKPRP